MKITLEKKESEKIFHDALCNGLSQLGYSDLELDYKDEDYAKAKKSLQAKLSEGKIPHEMFVFRGETPSICVEDVFMEILRLGLKLTVKDLQGGDYTKSIGLKEVHERVQKTDTRQLLQMTDGTGDASTAFEVLQMVFFEESVFG